MSIPYAAFCDPSYPLSNKYASIQRTVNFYAIANEDPGETKWKMGLEPSPGNAQFSALPTPVPFAQPCRGLIELRGNVYGVNGSTVYYLKPGGGMYSLGQIPNDGLPVSMVANGNAQIFICSFGLSQAGFGYVISNGNLVPVPVTPTGYLGGSYVTFQDGYFLVLTPAINPVPGHPKGTNQFQISGTDDVPVGDGTQWSAANVSIQAGQADDLVAIISQREYVRILGQRRSQVYFNVGAGGIGGFPFQSYNETFIETGCAAAGSLVDFQDSLIWIGQDARGFRACWRDYAFQPQRISNFGVEEQWESYPTIADAIAFAFTWKGHSMYQVTFPTANKTWLYDATVSQLIGRACWTERNFTNALGYQVARPERFHAYCYGSHLVGSGGTDGNPGAVYAYSGAQFTDCSRGADGTQTQAEIIRDRICPHIWSSNKRIIYNRIELELARGVGLDGNPPVGVTPLVWIKWSNDGGNTWQPWVTVPAGMIGNFGLRVLINNHGYARDRVYWVRCSDPVEWRFLSAQLDVTECGS